MLVVSLVLLVAVGLVVAVTLMMPTGSRSSSDRPRNGSANGGRATGTNDPAPENDPVGTNRGSGAADARTRVLAFSPAQYDVYELHADVAGLRIKATGSISRPVVAGIGDTLRDLTDRAPDLTRALSRAGVEIHVVGRKPELAELPSLSGRGDGAPTVTASGADPVAGDVYLVVPGDAADAPVSADDLAGCLIDSARLLLLDASESARELAPLETLDRVNEMCRGTDGSLAPFRKFEKMRDLGDMPLGSLRSANSSEKVLLIIENRLDHPVDVQWIDFNQRPRTLIPQLPPDARMRLQSFRGHAWFVAGPDGGVRSSWILSGSHSRLLIAIE